MKITNYIKLAWRVLGRRKFFSFITLFGICFTLGILMVILSFLQSELGTDNQLANKQDFVHVNTLALRTIHYDTIYKIDSSVFDGVALYDTTMERQEVGSSNSNQGMNNKIVDEFLTDIPSAARYTMYSEASFDVFLNGIKMTFGTLYADHHYWDVITHDILQGHSFNETDVKNKNKVILISDKTALEYYGNINGVIGQEMELDGKMFKVIGLYKNTGKIVEMLSPDVVMPYTHVKEEDQPSYYHGFFAVTFLKKDNIDAKQLKSDIAAAATTIPMDHPSNTNNFEKVQFYPKTHNEMFAQALYWDRDAEKSLKIMRWILLALLSFFIILPTLNLINLNVSRILERSSEIGVRKAFGAARSNILSQFVVENIVQTLIGGVLGLGLAILIINMINKAGHLGDAQLVLSPKFFLFSFLATLLFGVLSGLIPAYRMSKLEIANTLNQHKL